MLWYIRRNDITLCGLWTQVSNGFSSAVSIKQCLVDYSAEKPKNSLPRVTSCKCWENRGGYAFIERDKGLDVTEN